MQNNMMTQKDSKRILVTGGAGFIGTNLCRRLINEGNSVICLDDLSSGHLDNIKDLLDHPSFSFIEQSVTEKIDVDVDQIYHLACPASPVFYQADPLKTIRTCVDGAFQVLELARKNNAKVLLASTSEVYGEPLEHPQREEYRGNVNPDGIRACYDEGKRIAETIFNDHYRCYQTEIRIVRIFNTYGPFMNPNDGRVVTEFITQALKAEPITIYGNGSQTRSFCYVDDTVKALMAIEALDSYQGPINIGNPNEIQVRQLAEIVRKLTESTSELCFKPLPEDDPTRRCPDISKIGRLTGWKPETNLESGIEKTIQWIRSNL